MPKLFIHIGVPKTGSTAIQKFASDNRGRLLEHQLLYPNAALRGFGHHDIAFLLNGGYPDWATPQEATLNVLADRLKRECENYVGDILLSSENFYLFPTPEKLYRLVMDTGLANQREIRIVVYLRRQDELMVSWYNQLVKAQGFAGRFEEALEANVWLGNYHAELERWSECFGKDNMLVRRYLDRNAPSPDLMQGFWSIVCPEMVAEVKQTARESSNISLNRDLLEMQRIINRLPMPVVQKRRFHQKLMQLTALENNFFQYAPVARRVELNNLLAQYDDGNTQVSRTFFGGEPLFPAPTASDPTETIYAGLELEKAVAALAWMLLNK